MIPALGMELMPIPAGTFTMGSPDSEKGRYDNETPHPVKIRCSYWMGKTEVTQAQWQALMGTTIEQQRDKADEARRFGTTNAGAPLPMCFVNWQEAMDFCAVLDRQERAAGRIPKNYEYRLPTAAEWEYACRAGTTSRFSGGNDQSSLADAGWYAENAGTQAYPDAELEQDFELDDKSIWRDKLATRELRLHAVGDKRPNAWGLYDMHGNVLEWCLDWLDESSSNDKATDPFGSATGSFRIVRGGSGYAQSRLCRSAFCGGSLPALRGPHLGFRVVLAPVRP
jgi:formylglycine-generating enzyme required for sulfatase activity